MITSNVVDNKDDTNSKSISGEIAKALMDSISVHNPGPRYWFEKDHQYEAKTFSITKDMTCYDFVQQVFYAFKEKTIGQHQLVSLFKQKDKRVQYCPDFNKHYQILHSIFSSDLIDKKYNFPYNSYAHIVIDIIIDYITIYVPLNTIHIFWRGNYFGKSTLAICGGETWFERDDLISIKFLQKLDDIGYFKKRVQRTKYSNLEYDYYSLSSLKPSYWTNINDFCDKLLNKDNIINGHLRLKENTYLKYKYNSNRFWRSVHVHNDNNANINSCNTNDDDDENKLDTMSKNNLNDDDNKFEFGFWDYRIPRNIRIMHEIDLMIVGFDGDEIETSEYSFMNGNYWGKTIANRICFIDPSLKIDENDQSINDATKFEIQGYFITLKKPSLSKLESSNNVNDNSVNKIEDKKKRPFWIDFTMNWSKDYPKSPPMIQINCGHGKIIDISRTPDWNKFVQEWNRSFYCVDALEFALVSVIDKLYP